MAVAEKTQPEQPIDERTSISMTSTYAKPSEQTNIPASWLVPQNPFPGTEYYIG